jgi:hypothetical protein
LEYQCLPKRYFRQIHQHSVTPDEREVPFSEWYANELCRFYYYNTISTDCWSRCCFMSPSSSKQRSTEHRASTKNTIYNWSFVSL